MNESELLLAIQELLDGVEWTPDTLDAIAELLRGNGYQVRDIDDNEVDEVEAAHQKADREHEIWNDDQVGGV